MTDKVPCDLRNLTTQSVEELYELVVNKTLELQNLIKQQEAELIQLVPRFRMRLYHLEGTLAAFDGVGPHRVGHHELEILTSMRSARRNRNQPPQDGRG